MMKLFKLIFFVTLLFFISCDQPSEKSAEEEKTQTGQTVDQVLQGLTEKINANPESDLLYIERANYYLAKDDLDKALRDILFAIDINNRNPDHYITLSEAYLALGDPDRSFEGLEKALELDPENQEALLKKAQLYLIMQQYEKTYETISNLITIDQYNPTAYYIRGYALLEEGDTTKAIRNFVTAIDQKQDYYEAHMQLGAIYSSRNNPLAADYLNNSIEIKPNAPEPYYQLGLYFQENGNIEKAIETYNTILDIEPNYAFAKYNLGYVHLVYLRQFEVAAEYFTGFIQQMPDHYDAWYNRGYSYELMGDKAKARSDYEKALQLRTNYQRAIDGLNRLE
jgi:tetratricopeptide (TPR) repeat protein